MSDANFLIGMVGFTFLGGGLSYFLLLNSNKNFLFQAIGALLALGSLGGLLILGLMAAVYVYYKVSTLTVSLVGVIVAAPFAALPMWLLFKLIGSRSRESDGRGFEDGDGSN